MYKMKYLLFLSASIFSTTLSAGKMTPLHDKTNICKNCKIQPSIKNLKGHPKILINFTLKKEEKMVRVQALNFSYHNGQKHSDILTDDDLGWKEKLERFPFYSMDLNSDNFRDLALQVFSGNTSKYEYWIYNPKLKKYIHQSQPIFELSKSTDKGKIIYSNEIDLGMNKNGRETLSEEYTLDKNYKLIKSTGS